MKFDTVIFDIDGVLIDVSRSFRIVIAMVVADYLKNFERYFGPSVITPRTTQVFKDAGGFNNDWELTEAAILVSYYNREKLNKFSAITGLPHWYKGGGLAELYQKSDLPPLDRDWIIRRFKVLYAGKQYCKRLYGFEPEENIDGMIEKELVTLRKEVLSDRFNYGILTGRTKEETDLAIEKVGLKRSFFKAGVVWEVHKPDPQPFNELKFRNAIYIGDAIDDLKMMQDFDSKAKTVSFILVQTRYAEDEKRFAEALFVAHDVNEAMKFITEKNRGEWT